MRPEDLRRLMRPEDLIDWLGRPRRLYDLVLSGHAVVIFVAIPDPDEVAHRDRGAARSGP